MAQQVNQVHSLLTALATCDPWRYYWRGRDGQDHQHRETGGYYCWFCGSAPYEGHKDRCQRRQAREALGMQNAEDLYARPGGSHPDAMPRIICLCGEDVFEYTNASIRLMREGHIVLSPGGSDELHLRKIDLADEILVINPGGYIGESTRREIEYAERIGKPVRSLEGIPA